MVSFLDASWVRERVIAVASLAVMTAIAAPSADAFQTQHAAINRNRHGHVAFGHSKHFSQARPSASIGTRLGLVTDSSTMKAVSSTTDVALNVRMDGETSAAAAQSLDWSFLDAVYLITCPNADPNNERVEKTKGLLQEVGLLDRLQVKEFDTDDENRIRGCYTSHLSVLREAQKQFASTDSTRTAGNPFGNILQSIWKTSDKRDTASGNPTSSDNNSQRSTSPARRILVLEDNVALANSMSSGAIDAVNQFTLGSSSSGDDGSDDSNGSDDWDIIHLSYIPYVPDLTVSKLKNNKNFVRLTTGGLGSALGTTAYIINTDAINRLIAEDDANGFFAPIPDIMAKLFPTTRYATNPILFTRAPNTKSLVNPQLDDLRQLLFQPVVTSFVQSLLIQTGFTTNTMLQVIVVALLATTAASATSSYHAVMSLINTGSYDGPIVVALLSSLFTFFALGIIIQGALLAPKPPADADADVDDTSN